MTEKRRKAAEADPAGAAAQQLKAQRDQQNAANRKYRLKSKMIADHVAAAAADSEGGTDAGSLPMTMYSPMPLSTNVEALLEEAATGNGFNVSQVLVHTLPCTLRWLKARGDLGGDYPPHLACHFRAAGEACRHGSKYNSVGKTPRTILERAGVTFELIVSLIPIVSGLGNGAGKNSFSWYAFISCNSRYAPFVPFGRMLVELKSGTNATCIVTNATCIVIVHIHCTHRRHIQVASIRAEQGHARVGCRVEVWREDRREHDQARSDKVVLQINSDYIPRASAT